MKYKWGLYWKLYTWILSSRVTPGTWVHEAHVDSSSWWIPTPYSWSPVNCSVHHLCTSSRCCPLPVNTSKSQMIHTRFSSYTTAPCFQPLSSPRTRNWQTRPCCFDAGRSRCLVRSLFGPRTLCWCCSSASRALILSFAECTPSAFSAGIIAIAWVMVRGLLMCKTGAGSP